MKKVSKPLFHAVLRVFFYEKNNTQKFQANHSSVRLFDIFLKFLSLYSPSLISHISCKSLAVASFLFKTESALSVEIPIFHAVL